jgi:hypothetical protein
MKYYRTQVDWDILSCFGMRDASPYFVDTFDSHSVYAATDTAVNEPLSKRTLL